MFKSLLVFTLGEGEMEVGCFQDVNTVFGICFTSKDQRVGIRVTIYSVCREVGIIYVKI